MKLWECSAWDEDAEYYQLMVGDCKETIIKRWDDFIEDKMDGFYYGKNVKEVTEVDGYKIMLAAN
jgi:hypothetical protein